MRRSWILGAIFLCLAVAVVRCGGDSGGDSGGDGGSGSVTLLGPDGSEVTSIDASMPVAAEFTDLDANTQYTILVKDPDENVVCRTRVFTDNEGNIPASPYCYIRDKDTTRFANEGRVDTLLSKWDDIWGTFGGSRMQVAAGDWILAVLDAAGEDEIQEQTITVDTGLARACASNAAGFCARSFLKTNSNVHATIEQGTGISDGATVDIYVISDRCNLGFATGAPLQDVSGGADVGVTVTFAGGIFTTATPVWANPAHAGVFDLVIDVDQSGTYTAGDLVEIIDPVPGDSNNPGGLCGVGFTVQDAYSTGSPVIMQIAMDRNRAYQDIFSRSRNEDVYAQVQSQRRLIHKFGVMKYVVRHKDTWNNGDVLVDVIPPTLDEVQTGCTNQQRRLMAPIHLLEPGCYDIVFDVDGDGVYDVGGDAVDNIDLSGVATCGFIVVDDDIDVEITSITDSASAEVKDGTSDAISSKVAITGTADGFTVAAVVRAYAVSGSQQGGTLLGAVTDEGTFTIADMPLFSGQNIVKVQVVEGLGTDEPRFGSATATVTWNPGGAAGDIGIFATITWLEATDMDTHFIKTAGTYQGRSADANKTDCHYTNCTQDSNQALNWTTEPGTQTTSDDTSTGAIARLDLDCIGCPSKTENVWIKDAASVIPKDGKFLLCVVAYNGTDQPSMQVSIKGVAQLPLTAPGQIASSGGNDMWFAGYVSQDADGNLAWNAVNAVGAGAAVCAQ